MLAWFTGQQMVDQLVEVLSAPFVSGSIGLIGLLVSVIGLSMTATQARLAANQARRAAEISQESKTAVDQVLARIDRESLLLDATVAGDALARAVRDLGKKRMEDAVGEAGRAMAPIQRLLADHALETDVFGEGDTQQLKACVAAVGDVRTRLVGSKASSFPPEAVIRFAECLLEAERVLQRAIPIIRRRNRT